VKTTEQLHQLGQSLGSTILREFTHKRNPGTLHPRPLNHGTDLKSSIFDHAIRDTGFYDEAIRGKLQAAQLGEKLFFELALEDLKKSSRPVRPIHDATNGMDGWVSLEVSPILADEPVKTLEAASSYFTAADRPNLFHQDSRNSQGAIRD